ncbi:MAG TPA: phosphotransferase family protein [Dehalococcoidia bacterium]
MEGTAPPPELVDVERLARYLDGVLGGTAETRVEKHVAGYSNETFYVYRAGQAYVLRRPPRGPLLPTAHDVSREYRFLAALADTPVRVPRPVLFCDDPSVIGAPFYLMERKHGVVVRQELPPHLQPEAERRRMGQEMVDALAELHAVDWRALGLQGKAEGYLDRQLKRWQSQAELTVGRVRDLPGLREITDWLVRHKPESGDATVVHGDYKLDNVMFESRAPARLIAIFDWEMATIGDPLADLGWLLHTWGAPDPPDEGEEPPLTALPGFPTRDELAARYAERTGREMRRFPFYHVLALWKSAVILEGLYVGYKEGTAANPGAAAFEERVPRLIRRAHRVMERA